MTDPPALPSEMAAFDRDAALKALIETIGFERRSLKLLSDQHVSGLLAVASAPTQRAYHQYAEGADDG